MFLARVRVSSQYCMIYNPELENTDFNMSLREGIVPFEWKEANSIPLFKKGSRNKSVNYRQVSLTSVICKLLETIIRDHMMDFLIKHKLSLI